MPGGCAGSVAADAAPAAASADNAEQKDKPANPPADEKKATPAAEPAASQPAKDASAPAEKKPNEEQPAADGKQNAEAAKSKDKESEKPAPHQANPSQSRRKRKAEAGIGRQRKGKGENAEARQGPPGNADAQELDARKRRVKLGHSATLGLDLREAIKRLEKAAKDKSVSGVVLDIQNPDIGRGKIEELRGAIGRFRAAGKKVYATLDSAMPADYLVACACDEIVMPESGELILPGIHAEATFYKGLLAKVGVEADFIHIGDYKGAAEPLTREKFSEPVRENMTSLIDSLYDDMVTTIVKDRPLSIAQAKEVIDTGHDHGHARQGAGPDRSRRLLRYASRGAGRQLRRRAAGVRQELRQEGSRHRFLRPDGIRQADAGDDGRRARPPTTDRARKSPSSTPSVRS